MFVMLSHIHEVGRTSANLSEEALHLHSKEVAEDAAVFSCSGSCSG